MNKRLLGILVIILLMITTLPALAASATEVLIARGGNPYSVVLDDEHPYAKMDADGYPQIDGDENDYHWKLQDGVLTLRDCNTDNAYASIQCETGDLTIDLVGDNKIGSVNVKAGTLTFTGTGNLKLRTIDSHSVLTFDGQGTIDVGYETASGLHTDNRAIYCGNDIIVNGGCINALAGNVVFADSPSPGGTWEPGDSVGIYCLGNLIVNDGTVVAKSGKTPQFSNSYAIYLKKASYHSNEIKTKAVIMNGGSVTAIAGNCAGGNEKQSASSVAVYGNVKINDGSLVAKSTGVSSYGGSVGVNMRVEQSGGFFQAEGGYNYGLSQSSSAGVGTIQFDGGTAVMSSYDHAASRVSYVDGTTITSSQKRDGSTPETYDTDNLKMYRYIKLQFGTTPTPTVTPTIDPTATPTVTPTAEPTATPTVTPTADPTATPTVTPTAEPTAAPTVPPTVEPTATPTLAPTATPTEMPTLTPTIVPIVTPTIEPTRTPVVSATPDANSPPKTGDESMLSLWIAQLGISALCIGYVLIKKHLRHCSKEKE